jgi:hypothetical protein
VARSGEGEDRTELEEGRAGGGGLSGGAREAREEGAT